VCGDADTGYGNAVNVMRSVREFENTGLSGMQLEDQISPKRCPYLGSTPLVSIEEATGKIRAAIAARSDPEFVISARTDAATMEDAIARGKAYVAVGADMVHVISKFVVKNAQDARRLREAIGVPVSFSVCGMADENFTIAEIEEVGGCIIGFPFTAITTTAEAIRLNYAALRKGKEIRSLPQPRMELKAFELLIGMPEVERVQNEYLPSA
jgi:methylisocitrate lyase